MKQDDFEEYIDTLQNKKYVTSRKPSSIISNMYSLITIVIISIAIVVYTNYVIPAEKAQEKKNEKQINSH